MPTSVAASMPPKTVMPIERRAPAPAPGAKTSGSTPGGEGKAGLSTARARARPGASREDERQHAEDEGEGGHQHRAVALLEPGDRRLDQARAVAAPHLRELGDEDRVLGGEADQQDEADLCVDVVRMLREE